MRSTAAPPQMRLNFLVELEVILCDDIKLDTTSYYCQCGISRSSLESLMQLETHLTETIINSPILLAILS
jgi:hypothetical protein